MPGDAAVMPIVSWERFLELLEDDDEITDLCATELAISWRAADAFYVRQWMDWGERQWL